MVAMNNLTWNVPLSGIEKQDLKPINTRTYI